MEFASLNYAFQQAIKTLNLEFIIKKCQSLNIMNQNLNLESAISIFPSHSARAPYTTGNFRIKCHCKSSEKDKQQLP